METYRAQFFQMWCLVVLTLAWSVVPASAASQQFYFDYVQNAAAPATTFKLLKQPDCTGLPVVVSFAADQLTGSFTQTYLDTALTPNVTYCVTAVAVTATAVESVASNQISVMVPGATAPVIWRVRR